jgi:hypothetical protein
MKAPIWTNERIQGLSTAQIESLKVNAERMGSVELVFLCQDVMETRKSVKAALKQIKSEALDAGYVAGYHFICERARGVEHLKDGIFWSGSWVVSEANAKLSLEYGAYLSLHERKSDQSYLQGEVIDIRVAPRSMVDKENTGIEFKVRATDQPYDWIGTGTGEKGYLWEPLKTRSVSSNMNLSIDP